jgi:hypothetical protein
MYIAMPQVKTKVGKLKAGQEFTTALTHRPGRIIEISNSGGAEGAIVRLEQSRKYTTLVPEEKTIHREIVVWITQ